MSGLIVNRHNLQENVDAPVQRHPRFYITELIDQSAVNVNVEFVTEQVGVIA